MIRTLFLLTFWGLSILIVGPFLLLYTLLTGNADVMYRIANKLAITGVRLAGVKIEVRGMENLQPGRSYIFMSNHVSNLDPPVLVPSHSRPLFGAGKERGLSRSDSRHGDEDGGPGPG